MFLAFAQPQLFVCFFVSEPHLQALPRLFIFSHGELVANTQPSTNYHSCCNQKQACENVYGGEPDLNVPNEKVVLHADHIVDKEEVA